jgi:putative tryptophan/tyrosine transport system substrate-binding protein
VRRREFITLVGGTAAGWPRRGWGQQLDIPVVGLLSLESNDPSADRIRAFRRGLSEAGYVEGGNVLIEYRGADGKNDRLPALAGELVNRQVTVLTALGTTLGALAAKAATTKIPIVFATGVDPVAAGLVASLNRPGGNITGVTTLSAETEAKRLQLLHELLPTATIMALLVNPTNPPLAEPTTEALEGAARKLALRLHVLRASTEREFDPAFASLIELQASALVIGADQLFNSRMEQLAALALRHRIPAVYGFREFAAAGGLMSYGVPLVEAWYMAGAYTGRILKGAKPAELPVQQSTHVQFVINLKTAKTLGLTFPLALVGRADEVIE